MNPGRLGELARRRAALFNQLAQVEAEIAEELVADGAAPKPPKLRRPAYAAPTESVTPVDRARAEKALIARNYAVRPKRQRQGKTP